MVDKPLSEAWADLRLSDEKFDSDLRAAQRKLVAVTKQLEAAAKIEVTATLDTSKTKTQIEAELRRLRATSGIVLPVTADTKAAKVSVGELVAQVQGVDPTLDVDADTAAAQARLEALSAFEQIIVQVEVRDQQIIEAQESLIKLATLAASVDNEDIVIDADLRDAAIRAELVRLSALIEAVTGVPADIDVSLDARSVFDTFADIQALVVALETERIDLKVNADTSELAAVLASVSAFQNVTLQLDTRTAQINEARAALERLAVLVATINDARIVIDPDLRDAGVRTELGQLSTLIATITGQPANIDIDLTGDQVTVERLIEIQAIVEALDGRNIDLNVDIDGLAAATAELHGLDQAAADTVDARRGGLGRMATMLGFLGVGGVVAIGAAGAAITAFGVSSAAQLQGTVKSFENLLGSAEAADALFKELQAFAIPSPFDTQVLATTTKSLLAIGVTAEEVIPVVKDLGAIVALLGGGSNEAFGRLTLALGQIRSAVKPLTQDLRQITSAIPGFNTEMQLAQGVADRFGITVREAQEKIKDGAISGEEAFGIILERMREFPGVAGSIEAAAGTLQGKLSAFVDTVKVSLIDAFGPVTTQVTELLDPLQQSVEKVLPGLAESIARSLEDIIPRVPALVESLGVGLAPAFEGIFTGVGIAIEGLVPVIERLLPLIGELAPVVGQVLATLGPVAAETGATLGAILVPALSALADVLSIIPADVLAILVEAFLAFKAVQGVSGIINSINLSLGKIGQTAPVAAAGVEQAAVASTRLTRAMDRLQSVTRISGAAIAGAFAGIGLAADDATTKSLSAVGALASIASAAATGGAVGGAPGAVIAGGIATATTGIGFLIGKFQEGKREAAELEAAVKSMAQIIKTELDPSAFDEIDLAEVINTKGVQAAIQAIVNDKDLVDDLLTLGVGLVDINTHLQDSQAELDAWAESIINAKLAAAGFQEQVTVEAGVVSLVPETVDSDDIAALTPLLEKYQDGLDGIVTIQETVTGGVEELNEQLALQALGWPDAADAANLFEQRAAGVSGQIDDTTAAIAAQREALLELQRVQGTPPNQAANLFEQRLADLGDAEERAQKRAEILGETFETAFGQAEEAVDGVIGALREMHGLLDAEFATQNFRRDLQDFAESINQVTNQDAVDEGLRLEEQVANQRQKIIDQQGRIIDAQQKADLESAELQDEIDNAFRVGAVNRAAELQRRQARLGSDVADERSKLDADIAELRRLEQELASQDRTPKVLLDTVKAQAAAANVPLSDFLRFGTTDEAIQAQQEVIGPLIDQAISQIETEVETKGPAAGEALAQSLEAGLVATLTPALGADTAQQIVEAFLPGDVWFEQAEEAARLAKQAAIAEFAATGSIPLSTKLDADTKKTLSALEFLTEGGTIPLGLDIGDIEDTLDQVRLLSPEVKAELGLGPLGIQEVEDQIDQFKRNRQHGDQFTLSLDVDADTTATVNEIEGLSPQLGIVPDMTLVQLAIKTLEDTPVELKFVPATDETTQGLSPLLGVHRAPEPHPFLPGTAFRRGGIFEMGSHYTNREVVMPFARYGEPATHGEAVFVPTHGDRSRTERLLRYVAHKLSFDLTPQEGRRPRPQLHPGDQMPRPSMHDATIGVTVTPDMSVLDAALARLQARPVILTVIPAVRDLIERFTESDRRFTETYDKHMFVSDASHTDSSRGFGAPVPYKPETATTPQSAVERYWRETVVPFQVAASATTSASNGLAPVAGAAHTLERFLHDTTTAYHHGRDSAEAFIKVISDSSTLHDAGSDKQRLVELSERLMSTSVADREATHTKVDNRSQQFNLRESTLSERVREAIASTFVDHDRERTREADRVREHTSVMERLVPTASALERTREMLRETVTAAYPVEGSMVSVRAPDVHVEVPEVSVPEIDVASIVREVLAAAQPQRTPLTQREWDARGVHVERIEKLVIGDGASAKRRAFQFLDELKAMK